MLPFISVSGSTFAQGVAHGEVPPPEIRHDLGLYFQRFALEIGLSQAEVRRRAARYPGALETLRPEYLARMRGVASPRVPG